jgi:hypothetical protein
MIDLDCHDLTPPNDSSENGDAKAVLGDKDLKD